MHENRHYLGEIQKVISLLLKPSSLLFLFLVLGTQITIASDQKIDLEQFMSMTEQALRNPETAKKLKKAFSKWSDNDRRFLSIKLRDKMSEFNQLLPMQLDEFTTLDSVILAHDSVTQKHTLTNEIVGLIPKKELMHEMRGLLKNSTCTTPVSGLLVLMGYSFIYAYYEEDGRYYSSTIISPKECGY